jgi:peroxiredoxin Q/BCP
VGDKAPLFEGLSTKGKIRLEDFRGKSHVVLAFYFADFTPT